MKKQDGMVAIKYLGHVKWITKDLYELIKKSNYLYMATEATEEDLERERTGIMDMAVYTDDNPYEHNEDTEWIAKSLWDMIMKYKDEYPALKDREVEYHLGIDHEVWLLEQKGDWPRLTIIDVKECA